MKQVYFIIISLAVVLTDVYSQNTFPSTGNVGIGTTSPAFTLDLNMGQVSVNSNFGVNVSGDATSHPGFAGYSLKLNNSTLNASAFLRLARTSNTQFLGLEMASQSRDGIRFLTHGSSPIEVMRIDASGNVGIGINTPQSKLHVLGNSYFSNASIGRSGGHYDEFGYNVGFTGVNDNYTYRGSDFAASIRMGWNGAIEFRTAPNGTAGTALTLTEKMKLTRDGSLIVTGDIHVNHSFPYIQFNSSYWGSSSFIQTGVTLSCTANGDYMAFYNPDNKAFTFRQGSRNPLTIASNGNILISKSTQTNVEYKLDVDGKIRANEIVVNTTGADFVFEPSYKLLSLSELEVFIKENKHLPDIAPAKEMQENGVSSGEMHAKLLQKVEELTLYVIELKKENEKLKMEKDDQVKSLKNEIETLRIKIK